MLADESKTTRGLYVGLYSCSKQAE